MSAEDTRFRDLLLEKATSISGYMNCRLFVQCLTGASRLGDLPKVSVREARVGDIAIWGENPSRHLAVLIGNGEVIEVEEWGASPRVNLLSNVNDEYDPPTAYLRPSY